MDHKPGKDENWCPDMHPLLRWALERPLTYGACLVIVVSVVLALASRGYDDGSEPAFFEFHAPGKRAIERYGRIVEEESLKVGVDADVVRAILYVENARGWYDWIAGVIPGLESPIAGPMGLNPHTWEGLAGLTRSNAEDPRANIRAGVALIKELGDRISEPNTRKIAALYHDLGAVRVSEVPHGYAQRVDFVYRHKLWERDRSDVGCR